MFVYILTYFNEHHYIYSMPTVFKKHGIRFYFYSMEGNEPLHIHVMKGDAFGKVWIEPFIDIEYLYNFTTSEDHQILLLIQDNLNLIKTTWHEHFPPTL